MCAVIATAATMVIRKLLPQFGIAIARDTLRWTIVEGVIGLAMIGLLVLLAYIFLAPN